MSSFKPIVSEAKTDDEILDCHQTMTEVLNTYLSDKNKYLSSIRRQRKDHNYGLMLIRDENGSIASILGFRI
jgi:hypothetical protein